MGLKFGGTTYPIVVNPETNSLVECCDPFVGKMLDYWSSLINYYCEAAYSAAMGRQSKIADMKACAETCNVDPEPWLLSPRFTFPLLALYPAESSGTGNHTLIWNKVDIQYRLVYILPPMDLELARRVSPILVAVRRLLVHVTERLSDEHYNEGEEPLGTAGIQSCNFTSAQYGFLAGGNALAMPALSANVVVVEREGRDSTVETPLDRMNLTLDAAEGTDAHQVVARTDVGLSLRGKMKKVLKLRFFAVDEADVCDPFAPDVGPRRVVGKIYDAEEDRYVVADEPSELNLVGKHAIEGRPFFSKVVRNGRLIPADKETADALGVPFKAVSLCLLLLA